MIFNMTGGGRPMNFDVKAYATEALMDADTPKANTIGVITTTDITGWHFSATQPKNMANGEVWFSVGTSSPVEFNALKKNGIHVYPLSAKQMVSGALKNVTAKSWQGGKWVSWIRYLYKHGDECTDITGGWTNSGFAHNGISLGTVTKDSTGITVTGSSGSTYAGICTQNLIDWSEISELTVYSPTENAKVELRFFTGTNTATYASTFTSYVTDGVVTFSIGSITGTYRIVFYEHVFGGWTFTEVRYTK